MTHARARDPLLVALATLALAVLLYPGALLRGEAFFERDLHLDWYARLAAVWPRALRGRLAALGARARLRAAAARGPERAAAVPGDVAGAGAALGMRVHGLRARAPARSRALGTASARRAARARGARARGRPRSCSCSPARCSRRSTCGTTSPASPGCRGCCWPWTRVAEAAGNRSLRRAGARRSRCRSWPAPRTCAR